MQHDPSRSRDRAFVDICRGSLLAVRERLLRDRGAGEAELDAIEAEREIEWEELAQEEHTADVRSRLTEQQYAQLRQIDGALERIDRGTFGLCLQCGEPIAIERLEAQPWAATCAECARQLEAAGDDERVPIDAGQRPPGHSEDVPEARGDRRQHGTPLPPELETLDDAEVVEAVREAFRVEVGEALDDVRILFHDGAVILTGEVPNETLPEIARRIVEDEVGYEVVDRLLVTEFAGRPQPIEEAEAPPPKPPSDTVSFDPDDVEGEISEDVLEVEEEGLTFVPPTRPVPER